MPAARTDVFTSEDQQLAQWAKALAHPARIAILRILAQRQSCVCGELVELMPLAQATVSQHLRELKGAGLIQGSIEGPRVCYCLDPAGLSRLHAGFAALMAQVETSHDNPCC